MCVINVICFMYIHLFSAAYIIPMRRRRRLSLPSHLIRILRIPLFPLPLIPPCPLPPISLFRLIILLPTPWRCCKHCQLTKPCHLKYLPTFAISSDQPSIVRYCTQCHPQLAFIRIASRHLQNSIQSWLVSALHSPSYSLLARISGPKRSRVWKRRKGS